MNCRLQINKVLRLHRTFEFTTVSTFHLDTKQLQTLQPGAWIPSSGQRRKHREGQAGRRVCGWQEKQWGGVKEPRCVRWSMNTESAPNWDGWTVRVWAFSTKNLVYSYVEVGKHDKAILLDAAKTAGQVKFRRIPCKSWDAPPPPQPPTEQTV